MSGRMLGVADSQMTCKYVNIPYTSATVTQAVYICQFPCRLVAINGRPRVAGAGGTCTFDFYKCASGIAAASGTKQNKTTFDLVGTADANQTITTVADVDARTFNAGDSLNVVLTGTPTSAVGVVTVVFDPV